MNSSAWWFELVLRSCDGGKQHEEHRQEQEQQDWKEVTGQAGYWVSTDGTGTCSKNLHIFRHWKKKNSRNFY